MADTMDDVKRQVGEVGKNLRDAYTFKNARDSASRTIDRVKKSARETYNTYRDKARKATSSGRSRSR